MPVKKSVKVVHVLGSAGPKDRVNVNEVWLGAAVAVGVAGGVECAGPAGLGSVQRLEMG